MPAACPLAEAGGLPPSSTSSRDLFEGANGDRPREVRARPPLASLSSQKLTMTLAHAAIASQSAPRAYAARRSSSLTLIDDFELGRRRWSCGPAQPRHAPCAPRRDS